MSVSTHLWRIGTDTLTYTAEDSSGAGAASSGGRWNAQHSPVVYTSDRIALAYLETLVHFKASDLPLNRYLVRIAVPISVWKARIKLDPSRHVGWDAVPWGKVSVDAGEKWLKEQKSALLVVPSVVVPQEHNVLINPAHADSAKITFEKTEKWRYDTRLKL